MSEAQTTETTETPAAPAAPVVGDYFWPGDDQPGLWTLVDSRGHRYGGVLTTAQGWAVLGIPNCVTTEQLIADGFRGVPRAATRAVPPPLPSHAASTPPSGMSELRTLIEQYRDSTTARLDAIMAELAGRPPAGVIPAPVRRAVPQAVLAADTAADPHEQLTRDRWNYLVSQELQQMQRGARHTIENFDDAVTKLRIALSAEPNAPAALQALVRVAAACYNLARFGDGDARRPFTYDQYRDYPSGSDKPYESGDA